MGLTGNGAFFGPIVCLILSTFSQSSEQKIQSQLYEKMRTSSRFYEGVRIARISGSHLSVSTCAAFCNQRRCQSFEFGCFNASSPGSCSPCCRIYSNVPPLLEDKYFESRTGVDYYELKIHLPPQNYDRCETCDPETFCGEVVKRVPSEGLYTLAVRTVCYQIFLDASGALNWNLSRDSCTYRKGKLIEPADFEEQLLVVKLMNRMSNHSNYVQVGTPPISIWLGCKGRYKDWRWLDGSNVTHTFWQGTNPDSTREVNCCATLYANATAKAFWLDRYCADKTSYMCVYEKPA